MCSSDLTEVSTGLPFFDHMVEQLGRHGGFDLRVEARGDLAVDAHHTVEDVGIVLGACLAEALGDKRGIRRFASMLLPLDEALIEVALDPTAASEALHVGLLEHGRPKSGHVWFEGDLPASTQYDAEFVI